MKQCSDTARYPGDANGSGALRDEMPRHLEAIVPEEHAFADKESGDTEHAALDRRRRLLVEALGKGVARCLLQSRVGIESRRPEQRVLRAKLIKNTSR